MTQWPFAVEVALQRVLVNDRTGCEIGNGPPCRLGEHPHCRTAARRLVESVDDAPRRGVQRLELLKVDVRVTRSDAGTLLDARQVVTPVIKVGEPVVLVPELGRGELVEDVGVTAIEVEIASHDQGLRTLSADGGMVPGWFCGDWGVVLGWFLRKSRPFEQFMRT